MGTIVTLVPPLRFFDVRLSDQDVNDLCCAINDMRERFDASVANAAEFHARLTEIEDRLQELLRER